ncbi:MAG: autoinducer 2 ABC transporter substrate-binding protein [Treponema sp.]|jgi:simple sugar transport system substrate-binding protein|nr:autoinducer 2 ABC transporter substrate-binding protein [Treponema sp.]
MKRVICIAMILLFFAGSLFAGGRQAGGQASGQLTMVAIPKLKSAWFDDYEKGVLKAGTEFGVRTYMQAPAAADEAQQVRIIEDSINQGVNAVLVVPNDANSCVPAFTRAKQRNIVVLTHESPNQPGADYDIEMIDNVKFGERFVEELVAAIGDRGEYAIFVGSLTVPAHNIWADAAIAYAKARYPGLTLVAERFPVSENRNDARQRTLELLTTYPNLKGILAFGSQGAPGAGQAIRERNLQGKFAIFGTTSPNEINPFLKDSSVTKSILWSSGDAAYAMTYIAKLILDGKRSEIKQGMNIPNLGQPQIEGMNILFNNPLVVTTENVDNYDF